MILKTELKAKNKMQGIESLAVPVLGYSFGILNAYMFPEKREKDD
jgi:hypothetical protein